jgi:hypothetical protein
VFGQLAKLAPFHFEVDSDAWRASQKAPKHQIAAINCAPLVPIRTMKGASQCHMCGRCSGFRGAVGLARRSPNHEIVNVAGDMPSAWETALIVFGMIGIAGGAFHWSVSPWLIATKQMAARWLVEYAVLWPLEGTAPWWILTNYPDRNDVLTLLDGAVLIAYILTTAVGMSVAILVFLALANRALNRWSWSRFHHLAQSLIPIAGCGIFLGLSALSVTLLREEGLRLAWVGPARASLIAAAALWSLWLAIRIGRRYSESGLRRTSATVAMAGAIGIASAGPTLLFWVL